MEEEKKQILQEQTQKLDQILALLVQMRSEAIVPPKELEQNIASLQDQKQEELFMIQTHEAVQAMQSPPDNQSQSSQQTVPLYKQATFQQPAYQQPAYQQSAYQQSAYQQADPDYQQEAPNYQQNITASKQVQSDRTNRNNRNNTLEFKIGTGLLSAIGVVLILIALATLGINYMNDIMQGILLFVGTTAFVLIGELLIRKRLPKFAVAISSLGIAGLYLSVVLNYLYLIQLPDWAAIVLTVVITAVSVYLSLRNQSAIIRCLALIGGYVCLITMQDPITVTQLVIIIVILSIISSGHILFPLKKNNLAADFVTNVLNIIFYAMMMEYVNIDTFSGSLAAKIWVCVFGVIVVTAAGILCLRSIWRGKTSGGKLQVVPVIFYLGTLFYSILITSATFDEFWCYIPHILIALGFMYFGHSCGLRWLYYIQATSMAYVMAYNLLNPHAGDVISYCVPWIAIAILTFFLQLKFKDRLLSIWYYFYTLTSFVLFLFMDKLAVAAVYLLAFWMFFFLVRKKETNIDETLYDVICRYWILLFTLIFGYRWLDLLQEYLKIPVVRDAQWMWSKYILLYIIVMAAFVILTTSVERFKHKGTRIVNYVLLSTIVVIQLFAGFVNPVEFVIVFVLGSAVLLFIWKEPYVFKMKNKPLFFTIYLTYMYILAQNVFDVKESIILTIGLMLIALLSVAYGCIRRYKSLRIFGLVMSLIICAKLIFVDLSELELLLKIILFLVVGILALVISFIYNRMAKAPVYKEEVLYFDDEEQNSQKQNN